MGACLSEPLALVLDAGTTNIKAALVTKQLEIVWQQKLVNKKFTPQLSWVEQDPNFIIESSQHLLSQAMKATKKTVIGLGISNQRESVVAWDKITGQVLHPVLSWEDRRTQQYCEKLARDQKIAKIIREKTGLEINAYFSASKIKWLLDHLKLSGEQLANTAVGTIDSWLVYNLSGQHLTDFTNASRTLLYNIHSHQWDDELLDIFNVPKSILPAVKPSYSNFGNLKTKTDITIKAIMGDQQASLYAAGSEPGTVKVTYGTGIFPMRIIGDKFITKPSYSTTLAVGNDNKPVFALEGKVENAAARTTPVLDNPVKLDAVVKQLARETKPVLQPLLDGTKSIIVDGGISQNATLRAEQSQISNIAITQLPHFDGTVLGVAKLLFDNN